MFPLVDKCFFNSYSLLTFIIFNKDDDPDRKVVLTEDATKFADQMGIQLVSSMWKRCVNANNSHHIWKRCGHVNTCLINVEEVCEC